MISTAIKSIIETLSAGELTFRDWKDGGSLNHLTLDFGKYYVEHAATFFERHISMAIALSRTLRQGSDIIQKAGLSPNNQNLKSTYMPVIGHFVAGKMTSELRPSYRNKIHEIQIGSIQEIALNTFRDNLRPLRILEELLNKNEINQLAKSVGINPLNENQREWLKHLTEIRWAKLNPEYGAIHKKLRKLEHLCLMKIIGNDIDLENINKHIDANYRHLLKHLKITLPSPDYFDSLGIVDSKRRYRNIHKFISLVEAAGIIQFIAYTGWRESEFGFSLKDIEIQPNLDLLDQYACPARYDIQWVVPKTGGNTKLKREITRPAYLCALKLAQLANSTNESPCLYSFIASAKTPSDSATFVQKSVASLWNNFVEIYEPFSQLALLDELNALKKQAPLHNASNMHLANLSKRCDEERWESLGQDTLIREAYRRIRQEFDRVTFFLNIYSRKFFIWEYRMGTLNHNYRELLDQYLSDETKIVIQALKTKNEVTGTLTKAVTNELMIDYIYPTPHAFRHMWAESVYRRFDGDVGWMIRSNFKHISQNMWLAYIRNKDNRRQHDRVKRQVVSSLLSNYVRKNGAAYAGATDKLLRRLFLHTQTATLGQLDVAIEQFCLNEIEDIKSNPWGYCILRKRNQAHAKCAAQGVPQRQNASPTLCLGCTNNLTQEGNVEGILLGLSNDIKVIQNPKVPEAFRKASFQTVKNAHKQLKKLNVDKDSMIEIETALQVAKESKLL